MGNIELKRHNTSAAIPIRLILLAILFSNIDASGQVPPLFRQDTVSLCFMGDMMMHSMQIETARQMDGTYSFDSYFSLIKDRIASADIAIANMEFTLAGEPYTGYPCFSAPESFAEYLAECGFDIFLTANNHILDRGSEGAARTLEQYGILKEKHGILTTGAAEDESTLEDTYPLTVRRRGISLAFVNFTYGTNSGSTLHWPKINYMGRKAEITEALNRSRSADFTIALPHWGNEYELEHSQSQEETAAWLAENGADLIIGTHPHVVQDTSSVNGTRVIYSLGNAVSNMSAENTQLELMAEVRIVRHGNGGLGMLPVELTWLWCSRPGGFCNDYIVIPVEEYIDRPEVWHGRWDYDKMVRTYERVKRIINKQ